jgi:hypothetical protein
MVLFSLSHFWNVLFDIEHPLNFANGTPKLKAKCRHSDLCCVFLMIC